MADPFDDEGREPRGLDLPDECVYCVSCGTVFVHDRRRDCPTCTVAERVEELDEELDEIAEHQMEVLEETVGGPVGELLGQFTGGDTEDQA